MAAHHAHPSGGGPDAHGGEGPGTARDRATVVRPAAPDVAGGLTVLIFGAIQLAIAGRFVALLLDAREAGGAVAGLLGVSQFFVRPFEAIFRADALHAAGSMVDLVAILALVSWTVAEALTLWVIADFRPDTA